MRKYPSAEPHGLVLPVSFCWNRDFLEVRYEFGEGPVDLVGSLFLPVCPGSWYSTMPRVSMCLRLQFGNWVSTTRYSVACPCWCTGRRYTCSSPVLSAGGGCAWVWRLWLWRGVFGLGFLYEGAYPGLRNDRLGDLWGLFAVASSFLAILLRPFLSRLKRSDSGGVPA